MGVPLSEAMHWQGERFLPKVGPAWCGKYFGVLTLHMIALSKTDVTCEYCLRMMVNQGVIERCTECGTITWDTESFGLHELSH